VSAGPPPILPPPLRWLATHTGFPATRLPAPAERLVLFAAAAAVAPGRSSQLPPAGHLRDPNFAANLRRYTAQRRRVHIKCDNSAKT